MESPTKTSATKPVGSSKADATQVFRAMAGSDAKHTLERWSAATTESATLIQNSCSTAVKGAQDYNVKCIEFARINAQAASEFLQELSRVKSPSEFFELSTNQSRKQFETLVDQTRELTALAQEITRSTIEPLRAGSIKAFNNLS
ncbi:MAG TPA: phasin family protein [Pseudolabrys sp.]|jgi:hypothetical protein